MKHFPRLAAGMVAVMLATTACSSNSRTPIRYPGSGVQTRGTGNGNGSAKPNKNKGRRDEARCNAGRGNGNGNGRCRDGNRGRDNE
jgi:hypothetical protein